RPRPPGPAHRRDDHIRLVRQSRVRVVRDDPRQPAPRAVGRSGRDGGRRRWPLRRTVAGVPRGSAEGRHPGPVGRPRPAPLPDGPRPVVDDARRARTPAPVPAGGGPGAGHRPASPPPPGVMFPRIGAPPTRPRYRSLKPPIPAAASVRTGPALIALTRMPSGP